MRRGWVGVVALLLTGHLRPPYEVRVTALVDSPAGLPVGFRRRRLAEPATRTRPRRGGAREADSDHSRHHAGRPRAPGVAGERRALAAGRIRYGWSSTHTGPSVVLGWATGATGFGWSPTRSRSSSRCLPAARSVWQPRPGPRTSTEVWLRPGRRTAPCECDKAQKLAGRADILGTQLLTTDTRQDPRARQNKPLIPRPLASATRFLMSRHNNAAPQIGFRSGATVVVRRFCRRP